MSYGWPHGRRVDAVSMQPIYNFFYQDDARMQVFGGILLNDATRRTFDACHFEDFSFIRGQNDPLILKFPALTAREVSTSSMVNSRLCPATS